MLSFKYGIKHIECVTGVKRDQTCTPTLFVFTSKTYFVKKSILFVIKGTNATFCTPSIFINLNGVSDPDISGSNDVNTFESCFPTS